MARIEDAASPAGSEVELEKTEGMALEEFLPEPVAPSETQRRRAAPEGGRAAVAGMRTARVIRVSGRKASIALRGQSESIDAVIAPEMDIEVVSEARESGDSVLVELCEGEAPVIVAALKTQRAREIRFKAATVVIEGEKEILLRSGHGAIRIRQDGEIEVIGSRISAASRGLFRIIGRILRLN